VSDSERADLVAFRELEHLVHNLSEELGGFRRRALQAESRLRDVEGAGAPSATTLDRLAELDRENADLRARLKTASDRARQMLDRVRFVRQQHQKGAER
jgi:hypothetical protein